ncbi:MAG: hypothetical protein R2741_02165 [Methanolobus sp.]
MEDLKDSLKQFIESRLQEATRVQALYPEHTYVKPAPLRKLDLENQCPSLNSELRCSDTVSTKTDFKW